MNTKIKDIGLFWSVRELLKRMTPEERLDFWASLQDGYCPHCGGEDLPCHCSNDE